MSIHCISPVDGRYHGKTKRLAEYFSEKALIRYRILVEVKYLLQLSSTPGTGIRQISGEESKLLENLYILSDEDAEIVKAIESRGYKQIPATNHDVKAVEYFIKLKLKNTSLEDILEMVHFALTSEDINNLSYALMIRDALNGPFLDGAGKVYDSLYALSVRHKDCPMLSRTHGQPASPSTFGKEILIFVNRLKEELKTLDSIRIFAKLNGATGGYNAHSLVFPGVDWQQFTRDLIEGFNIKLSPGYGSEYFSGIGLRLAVNPVTPQIEPHDSYARIFDCLRRMNTILIDFSRDIWRYISDGWIKQKTVKGEIGSSAMPHKVNPIDFENAEGNFGLANALFDFFSHKLPVSRLQRDLSDSTVQRNIGVAFAHSFIGLQALLKGLGKIEVNSDLMLSALSDTPEVIAEAYQNILRAENVEKPYELLKEATRGRDITLENFYGLVEKLQVSGQVKKKLLSIRPENYTGIASKIVENFEPAVLK